MTSPRLTVIVPVHNGEGTLAEALGALRDSDLPREHWELLVVDDASTDRSPEIAARFADRVLRLDGAPHGPGFARNRGGEAAGGDALAFVDADILVHPDTLSRLLDVLAATPDAAAVFGAYDTAPRAPGFVSQYRNLIHHYVHASQPGDADTFWAGLGAVRRETFLRTGGFDEIRYPRPQIEDIELGYRLREAGHRIVLDPEIQGTHLKRWTLGQGIRCDVLDRGAPWMRLILERRSVGAGTLNVGLAERMYTVLTAVGTGGLAVAAVMWSPVVLTLALVCLAVVGVGNAPVVRWFARVRGPWFAVGVVPMRLLYYLLNGAAVVIAVIQRVAGRFGADRAAPSNRANGRSIRTDGPVGERTR